MTFRPVSGVSLADAVVDQLKTLILEGQLQPGDRIPPERDLCEKLGVSRTAVREAKRSLITMGLLEARPGGGTFVRDDVLDFLTESLEWGLLLETEGVAQLIEARSLLEVECAALAAERATEKDRDVLTKIAGDTQVALDKDDKNAFLEADLALHTAIAEATQNVVLVRMTLAMRSMLRGLFHAVWEIPGCAETAVGRHEEIVDAIMAGDPDRARKAMGKHLAEVEVKIWEGQTNRAQPNSQRVRDRANQA